MTKIGLRKAWFQVHKWIGLILAVVIIPISITGSALVWHDQIDEWMHPARHSGYGAATLASTDYAEAARRALGESERLSKVEIPHEPGEPVVASATRPGKGRRCSAAVEIAGIGALPAEVRAEPTLEHVPAVPGALPRDVPCASEVRMAGALLHRP